MSNQISLIDFSNIFAFFADEFRVIMIPHFFACISIFTLSLTLLSEEWKNITFLGLVYIYYSLLLPLRPSICILYQHLHRKNVVTKKRSKTLSTITIKSMVSMGD